MSTRGDGRIVRIDISAAADGAMRGWLLRLQLPRATLASALAAPVLRATIDGAPAAATLLLATASAAKPFAAGAPPAAGGGHVLEVRVPAAAHGREVEVVVGREKEK